MNGEKSLPTLDGNINCHSMKRYLYLILTLMLLSACADDPHVIDCLDRAEALMGDCPDSAYTLLTDCDSLITHQSKSTRMRHLMLTAEAENKLYLPMPSGTLFQPFLAKSNKNA